MKLPVDRTKLDIGAWLASLDLAGFAEAFAHNGIDGELLADLTNEDLKDIGVTRLADRKRLLQAIAELSGKPVAAGPAGAPDGAIRGEMRQVTVLFADISGFTKLSASLGAEKTHALLETYFNAVDGIVKSFDGSVDKHIGDSVMAVFGAPVAHDNDPERAARAALEIHEAVRVTGDKTGVPIQAHIGIASGQVVASGVGGDSHYTMTGNSVNLASRLTDAAGPGETLVSRTVYQAIEGAFESEDCGSIQLKGIAEPVPAFKLKARSRRRSATRPMVGRQLEIRQFAALLTACRQAGAGQAVLLRGEAGIGKTRLSEEFERLAAGEGFICHRTLVLDFGVGKGQDAVRALVRSLLSIPQGSPKAFRAAAAATASRDGLVEPGHAIFLNDLLDLPQPAQLRSLFDAMDNERRNAGSKETIAAIVRNLAARQPVFLIVEDIHWATPHILDHIAEITRVASDHPVILLLTTRIEGDPLNHAWRSQVAQTAFSTIDLRPLRREDAMAMASALFESGHKHAVSCVERAEGNPLFLEQLLRHAQASAGEGIPDSVQSLVQARVDALHPSDRLALQAASVLGQRFMPQALRQLIGREDYSFDTLIERFFIRRQSEAFLFAHALIQEGIYNSLLAAQRTELHLKAARIFEAGDPTLCAQHLDRAGDTGAAAAYLRAAMAQAEAFRLDGALTLIQRGIEIGTDRNVTCDLYCLRGDVLRNIGDTEGGIAAFEMASNYVVDDQRRCRVLIGMADGLRVSDRQMQALEILGNAQQIAEGNGYDHYLAGIHYLRGNLYFPLGNMEGCLDEHTKALSAARRVSSPEDEALALGGLGDAYYLQGLMQSAYDQFRSCVELSQAKGYHRIEAANRHMVGWTRMHQMEFAQAREDAAATIELARQISHRRAELLALMLTCILDIVTNRVDHFEENASLALDLARRSKAGNFEAQLLETWARYHFVMNQYDKALAMVDQALEVVQRVGTSFVGPTVLSTKARIVRDADASRELLRQGEAALDAGCVAHNHVWFAQSAIDAELARNAWSEAERYARRLEDYSRRQPMKWCKFTVERARALSAFGQGDRSPELVATLRRLAEEAGQAHLQPALPLLQQALQQSV